MNDSVLNLVHVLNYCVILKLLNYSYARLYSQKENWDSLIFNSEPIINRVDQISEQINVSQEEVQSAYFNVINSFKKSDDDEVYLLTIKDELYPEKIKKINRPPLVLFLKGDPSLLFSKSVAVVGTRNPSEEGIKRAQRISIELVENGYTVVSGLARGIDTAAHGATINSRGKTIAVIGTNLENSYPPENSSLQEVISKGHLLLSQFSFEQSLKPWNFPERNKVISAISEATVIVEAKREGGGAKIQGEYCLKQGKKLFIMKSFASLKLDWVNDFISRGAILLDDVSKIVSAIDLPSKSELDKRGYAFAEKV